MITRYAHCLLLSCALSLAAVHTADNSPNPQDYAIPDILPAETYLNPVLEISEENEDALWGICLAILIASIYSTNS